MDFLCSTIRAHIIASENSRFSTKFYTCCDVIGLFITFLLLDFQLLKLYNKTYNRALPVIKSNSYLLLLLIALQCYLRRSQCPSPCLFASVSLHAYADDTLLHLHYCHNEIASSVDQLERCVLDIGHWMSANRPKLNTDSAN